MGQYSVPLGLVRSTSDVDDLPGHHPQRTLFKYVAKLQGYIKQLFAPGSHAIQKWLSQYFR
jgi:hypothetical protein